MPRRARAFFIWTGLFLTLGIPLGFATSSEYLAWRDPIYISAGFAGVIALCLLLVQPLLAAGWLPGIHVLRSRRAHRVVGTALVVSVAVHVAGLWITSPSDINDALLLLSPTPFSVWGVAAMWALFAAALLVAVRRQSSPRTWRLAHTSLASVVVFGGAVHAMLIEGTMEPISKGMLCALAAIATAAAVVAPWLRARRRTSGRT